MKIGELKAIIADHPDDMQILIDMGAKFTDDGDLYTILVRPVRKCKAKLTKYGFAQSRPVKDEEAILCLIIE